MELRDLAAGRTPSALPPPARRHRNRFIALLRESYATGEAFGLPPVPPCEVSRVVRALRRAAEYADLGVKIRKRETDDGVMVVYQATDRGRSGGTA